MRLLIVSAILAGASLHAAGTLTVVSAASYRGGTFAPESIATAFGTDLGSQVTVVDSAGMSRTSQVFYASATQVNFLIPTGTATGVATVSITAGDGTVATTTVTVGPVSPGLFSTGMLLVVTAADGTQTISSLPFICPPNAVCAPPPGSLVPIGSTGAIVLWGTGIRGRSSLTNVTATIGGIGVPVLYAGPAPGFTGLDQVNLGLAPSFSGAGAVNIIVTADSQASNPVSVTLMGTSASDRAGQLVSQKTLNEKIQSLHGIQDTNDYRTVPGISATCQFCRR